MRFNARRRTLAWLITALMLLSSFVNIMPLAAASTGTNISPPAWRDAALNASGQTGQNLTLVRGVARDDSGETDCNIYEENSSVLTSVYGVDTYAVSGLQPTFAAQVSDAAGSESGDGPGVSATTEAAATALVAAATDHFGKTITLEFDRAMSDPAGKEGQFSISVDGTAKGIGTAALGSDSKQIMLYLSSPIGYAATPRTVTVSYTAGDITAADGTDLESFSAQNVTNNIISLELVDYEPVAAGTACADDPTGGKILTFTLKGRMDYDNVNLAIYFSNGFFRNLADNLSHPYVRFYNKDTGEEVALPNILTEPVPYTGALPDRYMEYTDWYFEQISGRAPLGLALQSCALEPNTTYVVEVLKGFSFHNGPINNTYKFEFTTTLDSQYKPSWPQNASLTTPYFSDSAVRLQWPAAEDNHGAAYTNGAVYNDDDVNYRYIPNLHYNIYQDNELIGTADEKATTYDVSNLNPGTTYTFMVKAVDFAGNESPALETTAAIPGAPQPPVLTADTTDNLCGYDVELTFTADSAWQDAITGITIDGASIAGKYIVTDGVIIIDGDVFTASGDYVVVVKAAGYSDATVIQKLLLPAYTGPTWPEGSSLTATDITKTGLTLTWSGACDDVAVTGYRVYQGDTLLTATPVTDVTYHVTGLAAGTQYTFTVQAGDADGNWSTDGPSATVTTSHSGGSGGSDDTQAPTWPANAAVTIGRTQTEATLTWPEATDNAGVAGYRIKRDGTELDSVVGSIMSYTDTGLERGNNTYIWSVEAFDEAGNYSRAITGQSVPGQNPLSFIAENSSLTTVDGDNSTDDGPIEGSATVPVNPTIRLYFDRGVTTDAVWSNNKQCFTMQAGTGTNVPIDVFRLGSTINDNLHYIFISPKSDLTSGKTYKIIISKNLTANNGHTLGESNGNKDEEVAFTVAGSSGSPGGGGASVTNNGPTSTTGSASVDPAVGATVSLGDMARVVIPAHALKETGSVTVDIKKVTSPPAIPAGFKVAGDVYEFSVGGKAAYSFAESVALTFQFDASQIGADEVPAVYYYDESQARWVNIGGTVSGSTITVQVDHFTKYTVFSIEKPATPVVAPTPGTLNDIDGHWALNNIEKLVALGVVSGYPDGSFRPDDTITRAEFATVLVKAFELPPQSGKVFADTTGHWAKDYIVTAAANGLVSGYDTGAFGPDELITREQIAVMIVKAARLTMISEETTFADDSAISAWAKDSVATVLKNGLLKGYPDNTFLPLGSATRAEAVTVLANAL